MNRTFKTSAMAFLAATTLLGLANPTPAAAWSYASTSGTPGSVTLPTAEMTDLYLLPGAWQPFLVINSGPIVYRSRATTGAQDVVGLYSLQRWDGYSWITQTQVTSSGQIPAGVSSVRLGNANFPLPSKGYYRVVWAFVWAVPGTMSPYGKAYVYPSATSDFKCSTIVRPCTSNAAYVQVGRLYSLGGGW